MGLHLTLRPARLRQNREGNATRRGAGPDVSVPQNLEKVPSVWFRF